MARINLKHPKTTLMFSLLLLFLILLAGYAIAGLHSRYLADDYCNDVEFMQQGFWKGQVHSYLNPMPYSSERCSLTLFSGIGWVLGGVRFMPVLPLASILFWALALYYAIQQGLQYFSFRLSPVIIAFLSVCSLFFTLYLAPNQYQILFWRSGMNTYLVPLLI